MDKRPAGISIIAFIYILIASIGLISSFSMSVENWFSTTITAIFGIAAVAFYFGKKWAWWIISTMTLFSISTNMTQLLLVMNNSDSIPNIQKFYLSFGGKLIVQSLILFFMFSAPVFSFLLL